VIHPRLNRSATRALVVCWPFLSIPRLWYFARAGLPDGAAALSSVALPVAVGLLRDGLAVTALLLPVQLAGRLRLAARLRDSLAGLPGAALTLALASLLAGLMIDVEFLRYFGFHSTVTHLSLAAEWERISSSVAYYLDPAAILVSFCLVPAGYVWTCGRPRLAVLERFAAAPAGLLASAALLGLGAAAGRVPIHSPLTANLAENYMIAFLADALSAGPLAGVRDAAAADVLAETPLPHPGLPTPTWRHFDPERPLVQATEHQLCRLGELRGEACERDEDGDGQAVLADCNDRAPSVHPGARDVPRNGVDEDCSGLDADPPNVVFIHWEGARAVNVGSLGYHIPATPRFDALTRDGVLFSNAYVNGTQTRWSLISVYCSSLDRFSNQWIFRHHPDVELLCWPEVLRRLGYETIYVHGGMIGFAGMLPRLGPWFLRRYDRSNDPIRRMRRFNWGATDRDVLDFTWRLLEERDDPRPFYLTVATLAVHHPFGVPEPRFAVDHGDPRNQIANVIRYSDDALGAFLERLLADPRFENTLVIVAADHGINWFSPHPEREQNVLWEDLVWVPLALLGRGWNQTPGVIDEVRQLADVGPTILDRLGVEIPNPFIGQSLLRRFGEREARAFFATANGGHSAGVRVGPLKFFVHLATGTRRLFDLAADRREEHDLSDDPRWRPRMRELERLALARWRANERLILENRIWSERYWLGPDGPPEPGAAP
jgi:hypothetical protein